MPRKSQWTEGAGDDEEFDNAPATAEKDAPKPAEQGAPGTKSVLTPAKDSLPVDTVAQNKDLQKGGQADQNKTAEQQIHSSNLPPERDPDKAWQEFAVQAAQGLYPRFREGTDYAIGRKTLEGDVELLAVSDEINIDWGKIEEGARKLAEANPYGPGYEPQPPLHAGEIKEEPPRRQAQQQPRQEAFQQPTPPKDPNFDAQGNRIRPRE